MKLWLLFIAVAFTAAVAIPLEDRDAALPTFKRVVCDDADSTYNLCVEVTYPDTAGSQDVMLMREKPNAPTVLKGHLKSNPKTKVVVILADEDSAEDTVVFKSNKVASCTRFSADISGSGESSCLNQAPLPPDTDYPDVGDEGGERATDRSLFEQQMFPRALDANGYKINVVVYYDDMFKEEFKERAVTRVEAIMAIVDEVYSEKATLKTELDVNTLEVVHAAGENWGVVNWYSPPLLRTLGNRFAAKSSKDANLYIFITGTKSQHGLGLAAGIGNVCDSSRVNRVNINKYSRGQQKGGDAYTAETVAHEMGHNLGMHHDCNNGDCRHWLSTFPGYRQINGVDCFGYMDYRDDTNYWSACSVSDFTTYINRQSTFCLAPLNGGSGGGGGGGSSCVDVGLTTKVWANEITWSVGSCTSNQAYTNGKVFTQQCCLAHGAYKITCNDSYGDGWHGGYLEINGKKYCENFTRGKKAEADITIG